MYKESIKYFKYFIFLLVFIIIFIIIFITFLKKLIFKYCYNIKYTNTIEKVDEPTIVPEFLNNFDKNIVKFLIYNLHIFNKKKIENYIVHYVKYKNINIIKIIFNTDTRIAWILVRGTMTEDEYEQDLKFNHVEVTNEFKCHNGFYNIYIEIQEQFIKILNHLKCNYIFCMGYSLGGGIITVASYFLFEKFNNVYIYVIGTPRCCDKLLNNYLKKYDFYKINNLSDIFIEAIPSVIPYYNISYEHNANRLYYFNYNDNNISKNHSLEIYFNNIDNLYELII